MNAFEDLTRGTAVRQASDRTFGLVMTAACGIFSLWPLLYGNQPRRWVLLAAGLFLLVSLIVPTVLRPLNLLWTRVGLLLHTIISPVVLGIVFYLVVLPTGMVMRLLGKRLLQLDADPGLPTYWVRRDPAGPAPETMSNQF